MIIIAESGSTKTNWLTETKELHETIGFNPLFFSSEDIYNELMKHNGLRALKDSVEEIFFYGASCSSDDRKKIIRDALQKYFANAENIKVDHDMMAAALATYDGRTCIACILGTGSNSRLFDGKKLSGDVPALGYILGDEGSGAYFGKKLLTSFLYHQLPAATTKILKEEYHLDKERILEAVYKKPHVNVYLATFAKVMTDSPDKEFMEKFAQEGFSDFFNFHVCCYPNYPKYPVHFVGSIAYHFKSSLQQVANKFGCELGTVDRNPVYRLLEWHLKNRN